MESPQLKTIVLLCIGSPEDSMEAAKWLIGHWERSYSPILRSIALEKRAKPWSRIAATYTLGLSGDRGTTDALIEILLDTHNSVVLRSHAAEALGNLRAIRAKSSVYRCLRSTKNAILTRSLKYALQELADTDERH